MEQIERGIYKQANGLFYVRKVGKACGYRVERKISDVPSLKAARSVRENLGIEIREALEARRTGFANWLSAVEAYALKAAIEKSPATVENEITMIKAYTADWSMMPPKAIDRLFINKNLPPKLEKVSENTRRGVVKYIKNSFRFLVDRGALETNPMEGFKMWGKKNRKQMPCMNFEETKLLLNKGYEQNHKWKDIFFVTYGLGLRSGEALALKWSDIDFNRGLATIQRAAVKNNRDRITTTKTDDTRTVAIYPALLQRLKTLFYERKDREEWVLPYDHEWRNGKAARVLRSFQREIGVQETNFHALRAAFITHLLSTGAGLADVKAMVGHKRTETTDFYVRNSGITVVGKTDRINMKDVVTAHLPSIDMNAFAAPESFMDELKGI